MIDKVATGAAIGKGDDQDKRGAALHHGGQERKEGGDV